MKLWQPPLPSNYTSESAESLIARIEARRAEIGDDLVILGHHYQQDDVIRFADFTGDSFGLSQLAAERVTEAGAKYVIFCGVHFMAESADILTPEDVKVILPDLSAGCSMADMANHDQCLDAWEQLTEELESAEGNVRLVPICYMNSSADIKAFCGEHGGAVCTSSNCAAVFDWALQGGATPLADGESARILFLPDQHLGRNTAASMLGPDGSAYQPDVDGHPAPDMCVWDPRTTDPLGGNTPEAIHRSTFYLWKGHCSVHKLFRPEHVAEIREQWPDVTVMVHPECAYEVCREADLTGSTAEIVKALENAEPGSRWSIGTEVHLVKRVCEAAAKRGVIARILSDCQCLCTTMYRIDLPHLLHAMDEIVEGRASNRVVVPPSVRQWSLAALDRMLEINAAKKPPTSD